MCDASCTALGSVDICDRQRLLQTVTSVACAACSAAAPLVLHSDFRCGVVAIECLATGVYAVSEADKLGMVDGSMSLLLPTVHIVWPSFASALAFASPAVQRRTLECLPRLCRTAGGEFLADRIARDVWPRLRRFLAVIPEGCSAADVKLKHAAVTCLRDIGAFECSLPALSEITEYFLSAIPSLRIAPPDLNALLECFEKADGDAVAITRYHLGLEASTLLKGRRRHASNLKQALKKSLFKKCTEYVVSK